MKLLGKEWKTPKLPELRLPKVYLPKLRLPGAGAVKRAKTRIAGARPTSVRLKKIAIPKVEFDVKSAKAKAAGAATAVAAAAAVLFSLTAPTLLPEDRTADMPQDRPAVVCTVQRPEEAQAEPALSDEERKRVRAPARRSVLSALMPVLRAVLSFLGTAAVQTLAFFFSALIARITGKPISGLLGFLGDVLVTFTVLLLFFGWLYKKLYPDRSLRSFYTWKNILLLLAASVAVSLVRVLCGLISDKAYALSVILDALGTLVVFAAAWWFLFTREGLLKRPLRAVLLSKTGAAITAMLVGGTVLSAVFRLLVLRDGKAAAYGECVMAFLICGLTAYFGGRLIRYVRRTKPRVV